MNTLTITIGILAPVITFLIGRYFRAKTKDDFNILQKKSNHWREQYMRSFFEVQNLKEQLKNPPKELQLHEEILKLQATISSLNYLEEQYLEIISNSPKFELVVNKDKHPAANDNYLYIEGELNGKREAGLLKLSDWSKAKERLLKNPEDKPL